MLPVFKKNILEFQNQYFSYSLGAPEGFIPPILEGLIIHEKFCLGYEMNVCKLQYSFFEMFEFIFDRVNV